MGIREIEGFFLSREREEGGGGKKLYGKNICPEENARLT